MTLTVPQWLLRGIDSVCVQWEIDLLGKTICQKAMWCREQRKALAADPRVRINPILLRFVKLASPMSSHHFCPLLQKQGCELNTAWCLKSLDPKEWSWVVFCGLLNFCCLHANAQMWTLRCGINLGSILAIWCWEWFCKALWAAEQHCSFLPTCLLCGGKKPFPCGWWLTQLTCAHWLGEAGNLTYTLHHDFKNQASLSWEISTDFAMCLPQDPPHTLLPSTVEGPWISEQKRLM